MKRLHLPLSLMVAAAAILAPVGARAVTADFSSEVCTTGSLKLCDTFTLTHSGGQFTLTAYNNVPPGNIPDPGYISGLALFYTGATVDGLPTFTPVSGTPGTADGWTLVDKTGSACNDVGSGVVNQSKIVVGNCTGGTGVQTVSVTFTSSLDLATIVADLEGGTILIGGDHVQSVNTSSCSLKFYSNGQIVSNGVITSNIDNDCGGTTVPEPLSMVLLGSGLLGLALPAARLHRRKQEEEKE